MAHEVQCSCPVGSGGDPFASCFSNALQCSIPQNFKNRLSPFLKLSGGCSGNEVCTNGFCVKNCKRDRDCDCGEACVSGICSQKCLSARDCKNGLNCIGGACGNGCLIDNDCAPNDACINGQCSDPCKGSVDCGNNAVCQTTGHRPVCLCKTGYERSSNGHGCIKAGCTNHNDCAGNKWCSKSKCQNPCAAPGTCGRNAQCR